MAHTEGTTQGIRSGLIDLSGVPLDEVGEVSGLADALAQLQGRLAHTSAPLCEGSMAASLCNGTVRKV
ncbi:hypothetical protein ABZ464_25720 [Streptomyces sp. NPDC005820]|uniref:hypothetical protein n=1 Tax=Streptomyces sp. NPDC005820 TaxID=3157069 RepID=UPI0034098312